MGKVILVSSGKGGTGKTMFSVNLGAVLAQREKRVILIDLDMGLRNMDIYLGMENKVVYNIMDVVSGICRIKKAMIKVDGFDTLYFMAASPRRDDRDITPLHMEVLCRQAAQIFRLHNNRLPGRHRRHAGCGAQTCGPGGDRDRA